MRYLLSIALVIAIVFSLEGPVPADVPRLINYQGYLTNPGGGSVAPGDYDITFSLYAVETAGTAIWTSGVQSVAVDDGKFSYNLGSNTTLPVDLFTSGSDLWLGIKVGEDTELVPRTRLVTAPYAFHAQSADTAGYSLSGGLSHWTLDGDLLKTTGAKGIVRGGVNNIHYGTTAGWTITNLGGINCTTGVDGQNYAYISIGGGEANAAWNTGAVVGGGYRNSSQGLRSTIGGGSGNTITTNLGFIGGGAGNLVSGTSGATIAGGYENIASGTRSTVCGGWTDTASGDNSFIGGGVGNHATSDRSGVACGYHNRSTGGFSFVGGGNSNESNGYMSSVLGGYQNVAGGYYSSIAGGRGNTIAEDGDYSYLFGIGSTLGADSTFMVDMPHIRFGDETDGYEFPTSDGTSGQVMTTNGAGQLSWNTNPSGGFTLPLIDSVPSAGTAFGVINNGTGHGIYARSDGRYGAAVHAYATYVGSKIEPGYNYGGYFVSSGIGEGKGVYAEGDAVGVYAVGSHAVEAYGQSEGVRGEAVDQGVIGVASSSLGIGVYGEANSTEGGNKYGGYFLGQGSGSYGIYAEGGRGGRFKANQAGLPAIYAEGDPVDSIAAEFDGKVIIQHTLGGSSEPEPGGLYRDNLPIAWARVQSDGSIVCDFGIESVVHEGDGYYVLYLHYFVESPPVVVNSRYGSKAADGSTAISSVPDTGPITGRDTTVSIGFWIDFHETTDFSVIVFGRPVDL